MYIKKNAKTNSCSIILGYKLLRDIGSSEEGFLSRMEGPRKDKK